MEITDIMMITIFKDGLIYCYGSICNHGKIRSTPIENDLIDRLQWAICEGLEYIDFKGHTYSYEINI